MFVIQIIGIYPKGGILNYNQMTAAEDLNYKDTILVLKSGRYGQIGGTQYLALEFLAENQPDVLKAEIISEPTYFGGFYHFDCKLLETGRIVKDISLRRDLLITKLETISCQVGNA